MRYAMRSGRLFSVTRVALVAVSILPFRDILTGFARPALSIRGNLHCGRRDSNNGTAGAINDGVVLNCDDDHLPSWLISECRARETLGAVNGAALTLLEGRI